MKLRAVMDTNVLVSGILWRGVPFELLRWAEKDNLVIYTSLEILAEVHRVLHHPKFQQYIDNQQASPGELFAKIASLCTIIQVDRVVKGVCSDADDEKFLSCALAANVEVLVSGDKHLLNLLQYQSVRIVIVKERSLRVMDQIAEITSDLNIKYDLSISPVVFSEQEYDMNAKMASPFSLAVHEIYLQGDYASLPEPG